MTLPSMETTSACSLETFGFSNTISQIADSRPIRMPEPPRPRRSPARLPLRIVNLPRIEPLPPRHGGIFRLPAPRHDEGDARAEQRDRDRAGRRGVLAPQRHRPHGAVDVGAE